MTEWRAEIEAIRERHAASFAPEGDSVRKLLRCIDSLTEKHGKLMVDGDPNRMRAQGFDEMQEAWGDAIHARARIEKERDAAHQRAEKAAKAERDHIVAWLRYENTDYHWSQAADELESGEDESFRLDIQMKGIQNEHQQTHQARQ